MSTKPVSAVVRHRGLQCPFNSSQYISISLHLLTTGCFLAFALTGCLDSISLLVSSIIFSVLTCCIVAAWLFTSSVDASIVPNSCFERCCCSSMYCFKRAQLKTRYCAVSKKKVIGMDHYFVWMNTAIGARNYVGFFMVALFSTLLLWSQMFISVLGLTNAAATTTTLAISSVQLLCSAVVAAPYTPLLGFHLHLVAKQTSTFDFLMARALAKASKRKAAAAAAAVTAAALPPAAATADVGTKQPTGSTQELTQTY